MAISVKNCWSFVSFFMDIDYICTRAKIDNH